MLIESPSLHAALDYAIEKHEGQKRKDGSPYVNHPIRVCTNVNKFMTDFLAEAKGSISNPDSLMESSMISALLHDTIEDTDATKDDIMRLFGKDVCSMVMDLTSDESLIEKLGKGEYLLQKLSSMPRISRIIKLCDRLDNVCDMASASDAFKTRYSTETRFITTGLLRRIKDKTLSLSRTELSIIDKIENEIKIYF
ncbi:bifunctional (p)ppGpp synthetase/guanosine-3',5'-bis(diphosphate) 3'-pyrophosphohydrolase [Aduncisulcus paluster]|uniref:Bifunctional (P)ppGpp synthetase/guanosine-3',5'-bis(Diphosphate) 3'-pyrophosphohydrolase n=1 Tax=Aduncisulcus paluster TaxID=2918883 RepID=A0ABQ5KKE5_9EUKA|nr:bifunctional (p)ppGpp synthetase/guanosine-3',5'-bis(diphosphate) 3'-pyrophosphohydrolase [Aduncisulcus paluster]